MDLKAFTNMKVSKKKYKNMAEDLKKDVKTHINTAKTLQGTIGKLEQKLSERDETISKLANDQTALRECKQYMARFGMLKGVSGFSQLPLKQQLEHVQALWDMSRKNMQALGFPTTEHASIDAALKHEDNMWKDHNADIGDFYVKRQELRAKNVTSCKDLYDRVAQMEAQYTLLVDSRNLLDADNIRQAQTIAKLRKELAQNKQSVQLGQT